MCIKYLTPVIFKTYLLGQQTQSSHFRSNFNNNNNIWKCIFLGGRQALVVPLVREYKNIKKNKKNTVTPHILPLSLHLPFTHRFLAALVPPSCPAAGRQAGLTTVSCNISSWRMPHGVWLWRKHIESFGGFSETENIRAGKTWENSHSVLNFRWWWWLERAECPSTTS